jgi:hypothetical protein
MATALYRTSWRGVSMNQQNEVVMHWLATGISLGSAFDEANSLIQLLQSSFKNLWLAMLPDNYSLSAILARRIGPTGGQYAIIDYEEGTEIGTRGSGNTANQVCPCVTLIPPMGVKSGGRVFLPTVSQTQIQLNVFTAGYITAVNNFFNPAIAFSSFLGGNIQLCIYSRKLNTSSEVSSFHLSPVIGFQRKRARPIGAG